MPPMVPMPLTFGREGPLDPGTRPASSSAIILSQLQNFSGALNYRL
jgi:hypothetical protein